MDSINSKIGGYISDEKAIVVYDLAFKECNRFPIEGTPKSFYLLENGNLVVLSDKNLLKLHTVDGEVVTLVTPVFLVIGTRVEE